MSAVAPAPTGRIVYTIFRDTSAARKYELAETWDEIVARIREPQTGTSKAALPLLSMGVYGSSKSSNGALRHAGNLIRVTGVEGDYDGEEVALETAAEKLALIGVRCVLYTTPTHRPEAPRWRVLAPLSEEHEPASRAQLVARINGVLGGILTSESFTLSQSFYFGRVAGVEYEAIAIDGDYIDHRDDLDSVAVFPEGQAASGGARDDTTDDELREKIRAGVSLHESLRGLSARWIARGMPPGDVASALLSLMDESTERGSARWASRCEEIPRLVASASLKFRDPRQGRPRLTIVHDVDADVDFGEPPAIELPPIEAYAADLDRMTEGRSSARSALPFRWAGEIIVRRDAEYVIKGVLGAARQATVIADPGAGKTFFTMAAACAATAGRPWYQHRTRKGLWLWLGLEGERGLELRTAAHLKAGVLERDAPLALVTIPLSLVTQVDDIIATVLEAAKERGEKPACVVVDTLSRALAGQEENSSEVMTAAVRAGDLIRKETSAAVVFVHHPAKNGNGSGRGHSSLYGAVDLELSINRNGDERVAVVKKNRDGSEGVEYPFRLDVVQLGQDSEGDPITSCVAVPTIAAPSTRTIVVRSENQKAAMRRLRAWLAKVTTDPVHLGTDEVHELMREAGISSRQRRFDIVEWLVAGGALTRSVAGYVVNREVLR